MARLPKFPLKIRPKKLAMLSVAFFLSFLIFDASSAPNGNLAGFKYDENDPLGPRHWQETYKTCSGKYQSPIDIEERLVTRVSLPTLEMRGFGTMPLSSTLTNNGHTVTLHVNVSKPLTISGGPLHAPLYNFSQLHFHWGVNDSVGSEDLINNRSYPMELHMVFYNTDYANAKEAQENGGLVVLAFFFEIKDSPNVEYADIIQMLRHVQYPNMSKVLQKNFPLSSLLPLDLDNYFTYIGSLTTPPCSEGVRWIDFKNPILLSHAQLEQFRTIHSTDGYLTHNSRPVQPLYNRAVWYNIAANKPQQSDQQNDKSRSSNLTYSGILILIVPLIKIFNFL